MNSKKFKFYLVNIIDASISFVAKVFAQIQVLMKISSNFEKMFVSNIRHDKPYRNNKP